MVDDAGTLLDHGGAGGAVGRTLGLTRGMRPRRSPVGCGASPRLSVYSLKCVIASRPGAS